MSMFMLCAAATALVSFGSSAVVGLVAAALRGSIDRLAPVAQARVWLSAAFLPALAAMAVMAAALAPSFGWILDHCAVAPDPHAHPHICADRHQEVLPSALVLAVGAALAVRVLVTAVRLGRASVASVIARRALGRLASPEVVAGALVLPFDEPQAFIVGLARPSLFVTRGLLSPQHCEHLEAVLAHERAHVRRRDALRRLFAFMVLSFHLPFVAAWIERKLARAHEMAADGEAAVAVRSPARVARALVRLVRAARHTPRFALAFGGSDVEARVTMLLDTRPRPNRPGLLALVGGMLVGIGFVASGAGAVHHGIEILLGILGG
jgi:Zn-dependent protease with chaperone function